jgi:hypothetical protein
VSVAARLTLFLGGLVAVAAVAAGLGLVVKPATGSKKAEEAHGMNAGSMDGTSTSNGLGVSDGTYTLALSRTTLVAGAAAPLQIRVLDQSGDVVTRFDEEAPGVRMHLIVVRRDFADYQHLHPKLQPDGSFVGRLTLPHAGAYRAFADFEIGGEKHVLGTDLLASGSFAAEQLPPVTRVAAVDGYRVELDGAPRAGAEAELAFQVARGGAAPRLDPYLGARGHLVALRVGDLAYSHVHPLDSDDEAGEVRFATEFATAGTHRLFFQFNADGAVHTVPFTVEVGR